MKITGETSDGYHTFNELYEFRLLYNAALFNVWANLSSHIPKVTKSWKHSDGEPCFGGGWFVVTAQLPTGQITNHYEAKDWDLFQIPEVETAPEWDGHTAQDVAKRLREFLTPPTKGDNDEEGASMKDKTSNELAWDIIGRCVFGKEWVEIGSPDNFEAAQINTTKLAKEIAGAITQKVNEAYDKGWNDHSEKPELDFETVKKREAFRLRSTNNEKGE